MDQTQKFLEMLQSPKSSKRYMGCEELRVAEKSSEEAVNALEQLIHDPDPGVAYAAVRALNSEANASVLLSLGRRPPELVKQAP